MSPRIASLILVGLFTIGAGARAQTATQPEVTAPGLKGMHANRHEGHRMQEGMHGNMGLHGLFMGGGKHTLGQETEGGVDKMVGHWLVDLNGTPEQRKKITAVVMAVRGELRSMGQDLHAQRQKAMDLMFANTLDTQALDKQHAEHTQLRDKMSLRLHRAMVDVLQILTPDQRARIKQKMQTHMNAHKHAERSGSGVQHHATPSLPAQR